MPETPLFRQPQTLAGFAARAAIALGFFALVFLAWQVRHAVALFFAAIVAAVIIDALAGPLTRRTPLPRSVTVPLVLVVLFGGLGLVLTWAAPSLKTQLDAVSNAFPMALDQLESWLSDNLAGVSDQVTTIVSHVAQYTTLAVSGVTGFILVVITGAFLALAPRTYARGFVRLFPVHRRAPLEAALDNAGRGLKGWLRGKVLSMSIVAVATGLGTWWVGLPAPLLLGLIAGLAEFVPIIGAILAAVPALVLAVSQDMQTVWWTIGVYLVVQQLESNVILPLIHERVAHLPPAILMFAFAAMGAVFGPVGIVIAAPLSLTLYLLVLDLWVRPMEDGAEAGAQSGPDTG
ncbi:AI-2E family transporter [Psychromarinibacter sp. C21-152]|uniref:AI-2E family transporter n=1 Tax=Psychromarinibacter sediminicola TaxID=3033385 RepID=A0AAE3NSI8_9RHOB|nr:AI-2E family transporter [Psychromarinibacter sediminicola]MDF0600150.1 AI-2E family transporter [Psychromarinibacter sediminicola]